MTKLKWVVYETLWQLGCLFNWIGEKLVELGAMLHKIRGEL